jgi:hypothetical protein
MTYPDLVASVLAALSVLLAILGVFIAVLAILGWTQFRGLARKAAAEAAREHIDSRMKGGDLQAHFEAMAQSFLESEFKSGALRSMVEERVNYVIFSGRQPEVDDRNGDDNGE